MAFGRSKKKLTSTPNAQVATPLLTAEDVINKRFKITKFSEGYDLDQVDAFLDEVVRALRAQQKTTNATPVMVAELHQLEALGLGAYFIDSQRAGYVVTERDQHGNIYATPGSSHRVRYPDIALPVTLLFAPVQG